MISPVMRFFWGFEMSMKINDLVLKKRWPRNNTDAKDDPYETPTFAYDREMDQLMVTNTFNRRWKKIALQGQMMKKKVRGKKQHTQEI